VDAHSGGLEAQNGAGLALKKPTQKKPTNPFMKIIQTFLLQTDFL
jgi:hypothetical protein